MPPKSKKPIIVAKNSNSMFNHSENEIKEPYCVQTVNVEVNVNRSEDGCTGCFKAIAGIFKK